VSYAVQLDEATHRYTVNGAPVPGVTHILRQITHDQFANIAPERIERKRIIGRRVHKITEMIDDDDLDEASLHSDFVGYVGAYRRFLSEHRVTWHVRERMLFNPVYNYCGMLDRVGWVDGRASLVDFKATADISPTSFPQVAAYGDSAQKNGFEWESLHVLQLKPNGQYVFTKPIVYADHFPVFVACLTQTLWRKKWINTPNQ
jgi:hypothetical protein